MNAQSGQGDTNSQMSLAQCKDRLKREKTQPASSQQDAASANQDQQCRDMVHNTSKNGSKNSDTAGQIDQSGH
jgi:hypothetical protein